MENRTLRFYYLMEFICPFVLLLIMKDEEKLLILLRELNVEVSLL